MDIDPPAAPGSDVHPSDTTVCGPKSILQAAQAEGWLGAKDRQLGGRFPSALIQAAQAASGITETTELLTYALAKVAFEDNYGAKLLALEGTVPRGTFIED